MAGPPPPAPAVPEAVTLADVERATAARLGPFFDLQATGGAPDSVTAPAVASTLPQGGYEDLYLLRRQATQAADRVAQVARTDPPTGQLFVDRRYADSVPPAGERVELHHLPPETLRRAVRLGLRRTWLREGVPLADDPAAGAGAAPVVPPTGAVDLTALTGWLTLPEQVLSVTDDRALAPEAGWDAVMAGGRTYLVLRGGAPNTNADGTARFTVWARRQQFAFVNGAFAPDGPTADDDRLAGPLELLAAAGHIEAWRIARDKLEAAAAEGRMPSQPEAAQEFTRMTVLTCPRLWRPNGRLGARDAARVGPLWGLPGAGGVRSPFGGVWVNGPAVP